ncbi:MAG: hypothetical protein K2W95_04690 [Candidatus Obscuribacterales bacterium]|nr:hypothetical protein [Candidatus Obscuribacterales bacterium]
MKIPKVIAHRGGAERTPENTLAGFKRSVEIGADGVEFDVHRCATGELVVIHDDDLQRTTNGVGLVKESSYSEIARLSAGKWFSPEFATERVPLLKDVLALFDERMLINIEVKNTPVGYPGIEDDLLEILAEYSHKKNVLVSSFDHHFLRRLRALDKELRIGILQAAMLVEPGEYAARFAATHYINAFDCLLPEAVAEAQNAGLTVMVWTLDHPREWAEALRFGVDAIITNDPDGLKVWLAGVATAESSRC